MKIALDSPNPAMDAEDISQVNINNVKKLRETMNKTGINILKEIQTEKVLAANSSTTPAILPGFETAFVASGGFVEITFSGSGFNNPRPNGYGYTYLYVDEKLVFLDAMYSGDNIDMQAPISFTKSIKLSGGNHKVKIMYASAGGGSFQYGRGGVSTNLTIKEIIL